MCEDDEEFAHLKDLSKHKFNMFITVRMRLVEESDDDQFSDAIINTEGYAEDDIVLWHTQDTRTSYEFHITGTKSYQHLYNASKPIRELFPNSNLEFNMCVGNTVPISRLNVHQARIALD